MKIVRLEANPGADSTLAQGHATDTLNPISAGWNAYTGPSSGELTAYADLTSSLLLGQTINRSVHWLPGQLDVESQGEHYLLRREGATFQQGRVSVFRVDDSETAPVASLEQWRAGLPAKTLGSLFCPAQTTGSQELSAHATGLDELLSVPLAEAVHRLESSRKADCCGSTPMTIGIDSNESLVRRRDTLLEHIESFMTERRAESSAIESQLAQLRDKRESYVQRVNELRDQLRYIDSELGQAQSRSRYAELSRIASEAENRRLSEGWSERLEELDSQIAKWRETLEELESRSAYLRSRLAQWRPDDASPEVALSDQRSGIAVAMRLLADLESEVSRFASMTNAPESLCCDAHARLNPLVETLGRHVRRISELVDQQDHALLGRSLHVELEQVDRSCVEVRRQVDALLDQRQVLLNAGRAADPRLAGWDFDTLSSDDLVALENRRAEVAEELALAERHANRIKSEQDQLQTRRARLLDSSQLREWQTELDTVQAQLATYKKSCCDGSRTPIKASTVLAQLSDGEFVGLRLTDDGRAFIATRRGGQELNRHELSHEEQLLVAWSLRIALIDLCAMRGLSLPVILDEPFEGLSDRHVANLVTAFDDLYRTGRQILLFTQRDEAIARLRSLGVNVRRFGSVPASAPKPAAQPVQKPAGTTKIKKTKQVVIEEPTGPVCLLSIDDSIEKFPVPIADRESVFARARVRTIGDLIGADPSAVSEELGLANVTAELVALWQTHLSLVCFVPGIGFADAKALAAAGILSPEDLSEADAESLATKLRESGFTNYSSSSLGDWIELSSDSLERWNKSSCARSWRRNSRERRQRVRENQSRSTRTRSSRSRSERSSSRSSSRSTTRRTRRDSEDRTRSYGDRDQRVRDRSEHDNERRSRLIERNTTSQPRFYLELEDNVEAAPSIGSKRASQLTAIGIVKVSDLIISDPADIATRLDIRRVDAEQVLTWIKQTKLMLMVPGLRVHDVQLLVGSGHEDPTAIADMTPTDLLAVVDPYCDTTQGQRYLRGGKRPDLEEVTDWIAWAKLRRDLSAV